MLAGPRVKIVGEDADAPKTLTLIKKHKPDNVIPDKAIPGGDAFGLVATLSENVPAPKIVMLSADDNQTYMARAHAAAAA